jgi:hypothetical protein
MPTQGNRIPASLLELFLTGIHRLPCGEAKQAGGELVVTFEVARRMALALDHTEEGKSYGTPGFKVGGVLFARLHQNLDALVVRTDFEQRAELMAADPETYFITDHYLNYEWVLVRLERVHPDALRDLLRGAWRAAAADKKKKRSATRRR